MSRIRKISVCSLLPLQFNANDEYDYVYVQFEGPLSGHPRDTRNGSTIGRHLLNLGQWVSFTIFVK